MKDKKENDGVAVQLRMNRQLLERLDEYRKNQYRSRSSVIQEAVHLLLEQGEGKK